MIEVHITRSTLLKRARCIIDSRRLKYQFSSLIIQSCITAMSTQKEKEREIMKRERYRVYLSSEIPIRWERSFG